MPVPEIDSGRIFDAILRSGVTHCVRGHLRTVENSYIRARNGVIECRDCWRIIRNTPEAKKKARQYQRKRRGTPKRDLRFCIRGHRKSGKNLYVRKNGRKECRTCMQARASTPEQRAKQLAHRIRRGVKPKVVQTKLEKFLDRVSPEPNTGCWLWLGSYRNDYAIFCWEKRVQNASHVALEVISGIIVPHGKYACHKCDTPACVNPDHLFIGTALENNRDCHAKGRAAIGVRHGLTHLTPDDIRAIRGCSTPHFILAKKYNVSPGNIAAIRALKSWRHVQ